MEIYIAHFFARYDNGATFAWASAHKTRAEAVRAINAEIVLTLNAVCYGEADIGRETDAAWARGDETEAHDAILEYGDLTKWCDITQTNV